MIGPSSGLLAATSSKPDILLGERDAQDAVEVGAVEVGSVRPLARPVQAPAAPPLPGGNPLWSIPLSALPATQERPIFSASRRPPPRAVAVSVETAAPAPLPPTEPDRLALVLIGAVVGDGEAIAIFVDRASQKVVRLRQGDNHSGWVLSAVQGREVTLKKAGQSEVLVLQRQEGSDSAPATLPAPVIPAAGIGNTGTPYAPFTPRSTPKNGEHDGL
ncbi:MAG: hypothetical protein PS018_07490 [bacterium]|nr:hypothetical protein [bacterium]